jgi:hypothetical protein
MKILIFFEIFERGRSVFNRGINRAISRNTELLEIHCFYIIVKVRNVIKMIMFQASLAVGVVFKCLRQRSVGLKHSRMNFSH